MSKRKRGEEEESQDGTSEQLRSTGRFQARFGKSVNDLKSALKLGRAFERQKMGRRQKQASNEPKTLLRLREEVILLKQLDLEKTAKSYLVKYLLKIKRIREHPTFVRVFGDDPKVEAVRPGAEANVIARLFKSAPVKEAVDKIVDSLYKTLGLQPGPGIKSQLQKTSSRHQTNIEHRDGHLPLGEKESEQGNDSDLTDTYVDRLAQSDDEDSFASFGSESISRSESPVSPPEIDSTTAFLPSLGMAGYYSGSDSEESDAGPPEPKQRNNRRGQRARQQLAELKFGRNAKHLQKPQSDKGREAGWDAKRGAVDIGRRHYSRGTGSNTIEVSFSGGRGNQSKEAGITNQKPKVRGDSVPLHPSWQAAKQRKQQTGGQAAFTGKKVTFD